MRALLLLLLAALSFASNAAAQTRTHQQMWRDRAEAIAKLRSQPPLNYVEKIEDEININRNLEPFALFAYEQSLTRELRLLEDARTDKQVGSPTAAGGSTSLVSKGAVPAILGFAVEHGALTQTSDDTNVTFRGNGIGWLDLVKNQNFIASYDDDSAFVRQLRRLSYSLTFNTGQAEPAAIAARPGPDQVKQAADQAGQQLTSYSVRLSIIDQRDPRRRDNRDAAQQFMAGAGADLLRASLLFDAVVTSNEYADWLAVSQVALGTPDQLTVDDIVRILYARLEVLRQLMIARIPDFDTRLIGLVKALGSFEASRGQWFAELQKRFLMAAELVRERPTDQPLAWTGRIIAEGRPGRSLWDITGNFAVSYQDSGTAMVPQPKDTGGRRDLQLAVQAERPLGNPASCVIGGSAIGRPVFSIEYLGRNLRDTAVVHFAGYDFDVEPGWIHAAQVKVTIPVKGSGVKIPLSVSIANRTELLKEKNVRAHFGLTFDLDALTSVVRP